MNAMSKSLQIFLNVVRSVTASALLIAVSSLHAAPQLVAGGLTNFSIDANGVLYGWGGGANGVGTQTSKPTPLAVWCLSKLPEPDEVGPGFSGSLLQATYCSGSSLSLRHCQRFTAGSQRACPSTLRFLRPTSRGRSNQAPADRLTTVGRPPTAHL